MLAAVGLGLQAERALGVVETHLLAIGDVGGRRRDVVVDTLKVRGDLGCALFGAENLPEELVGGADVVERPVDAQGRDVRLALELLRGRDVRCGKRRARAVDDELDVLLEQHLAVDLAAARERSHVDEVLGSRGQVAQFLLGVLHARAAEQLRCERKHEDLRKGAREVHAFELVDRGDGSRAAPGVGELAGAAERRVEARFHPHVVEGPRHLICRAARQKPA